jgi:hypothetical protein
MTSQYILSVLVFSCYMLAFVPSWISMNLTLLTFSLFLKLNCIQAHTAKALTRLYPKKKRSKQQASKQTNKEINKHTHALRNYSRRSFTRNVRDLTCYGLTIFPEFG